MIHDVGLARADSKVHEKYTAVQRQNHLQVNVQRHCMERKTTRLKNVFKNLLKFRSMLAGFLAVVGHSWDLDQKRNGTRIVPINQTEIWTELQKL